ncbi:MAG: hypothetical protein CMG64_01465 [Candidatus Marinimicrobia bacterium]|nr:hypothetical protein [Candidatus Neomarinimicrobiota bacterium]
MKKIFVALLFGFVFSESPNSIINQNYFNRDCSDITNPNECYNMGCEWIVMYEQIGNELIITEECIDSDNNNNEDEENDSSECLEDCEGFEYVNPEENPYEACDWIIFNFGPNNFFNECAEDCDDETIMEINEIVEVCLQCLADNNCDDLFDDEDSYCEDLSQDECVSIDGCEWISGNMSGAGYCVEDNSDNQDCDSDLACGEMITCWEDGLLYPTTCGPENCDDPIGECDDGNIGCQSDDGQWYDIGSEMFMNDCDYLECTPNGWLGPFTLDNDDCSNDGVLCSDINNLYECYAMGCEWISGNMPGAGYCVENDSDNQDCDSDLACGDMITCWEDGLLYPTTCGPENCDDPIGECDNDGPPECLEDCAGIENVNPDENPYETCDWIISNFGPNNFFNECAEDCDDETMMEINEIVEVCFQCLSDNNCDNAFDDNEDNCNELDENSCVENPNCNPNYNAAGGFENCEEIDDQQFGYLYGTVEYIYGDAIAFMPLAPIYIESMPSNTDIFYFETMTDGEGYYEIELPIGAYNVTAYVNGESLTQEVFIGVAEQIELNFLLGDWNGPWEPYAQLSLGEYHTTIPGGEVTVPLYLSSNDFVGGVQFTIATNEPGLNLSAIESIDSCFSANFNMIDDLQSIGIIFSLEGCTYPPEEMLEIATMVFNVSPYITVGTELELFFNNTIVSDSIGNEIPSYGEGAIIMLGEKGDVNADGEINVLDIVMIVNFALYVESPNDSEFWASDTNNDGAINVLDVVQLVNIILED